MRAVATPGRWVWGFSGLVTAAALAVPGTYLITAAGIPSNGPGCPALSASPRATSATSSCPRPSTACSQPPDTVTRTVTVPQPVTSLTVQSYGAPVQVTAGPVSRVQVTETLTHDPGASGPPAVSQSVSDGHLSLADPAGALSAPPDNGPGAQPQSAQPQSAQPQSAQPQSASPADGPGALPGNGPGHCAVGFAVTVPPGVTVTAVTDGGPVTVSGTAGANLDSGGGPVRATRIGGPLTVSTGGGPLLLNGLVGALRADLAGGSLFARDVAAATAVVTAGGGDVRIAFSAVPDTVTVGTDGGSATLTVPGGPYALTADSAGGPEVVRIATDPAARRLITVTSGGGPLRIEPSAGRLSAPGPGPGSP